MLRINEFTFGNRSNHNIMYENVVVNTDNVVLTLLSYKNCAAPVSLLLNAVRNKTICPVRAMRSYLINRGTNSGYFFLQADGSPISRSYFTKRLNEYLKFYGVDTQIITSHSFRIGGMQPAVVTLKTLLKKWMDGNLMPYHVKSTYRPCKLGQAHMITWATT